MPRLEHERGEVEAVAAPSPAAPQASTQACRRSRALSQQAPLNPSAQHDRHGGFVGGTRGRSSPGARPHPLLHNGSDSPVLTSRPAQLPSGLGAAALAGVHDTSATAAAHTRDTVTTDAMTSHLPDPRAPPLPGPRAAPTPQSNPSHTGAAGEITARVQGIDVNGTDATMVDRDVRADAAAEQYRFEVASTSQQPQTGAPRTPPKTSPVAPYRPTAVYCPRSAVPAYSEGFNHSLRLFRDAVNRGSVDGIEAALQHKLMLSGRALCGAGSSRGRAKRTMEEIQAYLTGQSGAASLAEARRRAEAELPAPPARLPVRVPKNNAEAIRMRTQRIMSHLKNGAPGKAANALRDTPVVTATTAVRAKLAALHPPGDPEAVVRRLPPRDPHAHFTPWSRDHVLSVIRDKCPHNSAGGPSQERFEHVRAACLYSEESVDALTDLCNAIAGNTLPFLPDLTAARLLTLLKVTPTQEQLLADNLPIRPIAMGEVISRLTQACSLAAHPEAGPS